MSWQGDWGRKVKIDIQASLADANLSYFPILITEACLPAEVLDTTSGYECQSDGGDLRFYTGDYSSSDPATENTNRIACEIVELTRAAGSGGTCQIWVRIPSINSSTGAVITLYYNATGKSQPAVAAAYGSQETWDENGSNNYRGVWHVNDASGNLTDSTENSLTLTANQIAGYQQSGKIGYAIDLDGTDSYASATSPISDVPFTLSCWVKFDAINQQASILSLQYTASANRHFVNVWDDEKFYSSSKDGGLDEAVSTTIHTTATWYHVAGVFAAHNDRRLFVDGSKFTNTDTDGVGTVLEELVIGGNIYGQSYELDGQLDEIRVSNVTRSDAWLVAEYRNQDAPATYVVEGTPTSIGTILVVKSSKHNNLVIDKNLSLNLLLNINNTYHNNFVELISLLLGKQLIIKDTFHENLTFVLSVILGKTLVVDSIEHDLLSSIVNLNVTFEKLLIITNIVNGVYSGKSNLILGKQLQIQSTVNDVFFGVVSLLIDRLLILKSNFHDNLVKSGIDLLIGKLIKIKSTVHDNFTEIINLLIGNFLDVNSTVHDNLASIVTLELEGLVVLIVLSTVHDNLIDKSDLPLGTSLLIDSTIHDNLTSKLFNVINKFLSARNTTHDNLATKIDLLLDKLFSVFNSVLILSSSIKSTSLDRTIDVQSAVHEQFSKIKSLVALIYNIIPNSTVHDNLAEIPENLIEIILVAESVVNDLLSNNAELIINKSLTINSAVNDLISTNLNLAGALSLIVINSVVFQLTGKTVITIGTIVALYNFIAKNLSFVFETEDMKTVFSAKDIENI